MASPCYSFDDFARLCKDAPSVIFIPRGVIQDAQRDFNLNTKEDILGFIAQGGLENLEFRKSDIWENNPKPKEHNILADVYYFNSGETYGYFAFLKNTVLSNWQIKSFKKNDRVPPAGIIEPAAAKMFAGLDLGKMISLKDKED